MSTANNGAIEAPYNNKCIDFTQRSLMEALRWVVANGSKQAEFTSRSDKNKYVMIYASGRMVFYTRARYNGEGPRIELGEISTHTLDQIHQTYLEVRKNIADGIDPRLIRSRDMTYADFFDQIYIADRQNNGKKSLKADLSRDLHWLRPRFGHLRLTAIHNRIALDLVTDMRVAGKAVSTIRNVVSLLKSVLQLAVDMDLLVRHPIRYRPPAATPRRPRTCPKLAEIARFTMAAWSCTGAEYSAGRMWALLALTGARTGEAMNARVVDIEFNENGVPVLWHLPQQKSGKPGTIPLSAPEVRQIVSELINSSQGEYLIPGLHGNARISRPIKLFKRICARAKVQGEWTPHQLRRAFATIAATEVKLPTDIIAKQLRHNSPAVTERFYILKDDQVSLCEANDAVVNLIMANLRAHQPV